MGILAQAEVPDYKEKYNLAGTPDAEVDLSPYYGDKYKLVGVEIKGMHNYSFRQFKSGSNQNPLVKKYIMQVHSYMLLKGVDFWVMFCENKDNQEYCERIIERDERIIKYLKKRNKYMIKVRKNSALPAVECGMDESDPQFVKCPQARNCVKSIDKVASMPPLKNRKKYERDARRALA